MAEIYFQKMTPEGYHEIEEQIEELKKDRPTKIARLKAARALGDLSENTEYSTAKRDLRHLESRLRFLNKQLTYAQIVQPQANGTIDLGSSVTIEFLDDHEQVTYKLVGTQEADLAAQKLAFDSPLGQALMDQGAGTTVTVESPDSTYQVKIIEVS
ncbi:transcription elongation factor GreA [Limosilactobacillus caecicola]|uniref:transcription elongation factor GreA n=1 Tax=Limosilactobacillus caecicola TaxID=2941332 RepID=UPI00203C4006|nr:transcription elongation factor GreA [Limosilactobacillus caecicola]